MKGEFVALMKCGEPTGTLRVLLCVHIVPEKAMERGVFCLCVVGSHKTLRKCSDVRHTLSGRRQGVK